MFLISWSIVWKIVAVVSEVLLWIPLLLYFQICNTRALVTIFRRRNQCFHPKVAAEAETLLALKFFASLLQIHASSSDQLINICNGPLIQEKTILYISELWPHLRWRWPLVYGFREQRQLHVWLNMLDAKMCTFVCQLVLYIVLFWIDTVLLANTKNGSFL